MPYKPKKNNENFINLPNDLYAYTKIAKKIGNGGVIKFILEFDCPFWLDGKFLKERNISAPSYIFTGEKIHHMVDAISFKSAITHWMACRALFL